MTVDPQNVKAERKRLFRLAQLIKAGEKPASALYEQYGSWKAHAAKGNSKSCCSAWVSMLNLCWRG